VSDSGSVLLHSGQLVGRGSGAGHSLRRSYVGSKRWGGLEESVELAGDVADQAASDLPVGLAFGTPPLAEPSTTSKLVT
jgi:hypothetical protein